MQSKKLILVILLGIFWGGNFPVSKIALNTIDPYILRVLSCLLSLIVYIVFSYPIRKSFKKINKEQYIKLFLLSIPIVVIVPLFNLLALTFMNSASAVILIYAMPALNSLIYILLERNISPKNITPILLCMLGIFFTLGASDITLGRGELIILFGAFIWAIGGVLNDRFSIELDVRIISTVQLVFATLITLFLILLYPKIWQFSISSMQFSTREFFSVFYVGVVANGLAFIVFYKLLINYGSSYTSYSLMLVPVIGIILSATINNEHISFNQSLGLILMCVSMLCKNFIFKEKRRA